jgi:hypothetical protein
MGSLSIQREKIGLERATTALTLSFAMAVVRNGVVVACITAPLIANSLIPSREPYDPIHVAEFVVALVIVVINKLYKSTAIRKVAKGKRFDLHTYSELLA